MRKERIYSLRLTSGMRNALETAAKRDRRSIASLVEKIIADYLAKEGIDWEKAPSHHDRRQYPRKDVSLPARLMIQQNLEIYEETEALVEDMSLGGAYVTYTDGERSSLRLHATIHLVVRLPRSDAALDLSCCAVRVIRDKEKVGVGLQYRQVGNENLALIDRFLH